MHFFISRLVAISNKYQEPDVATDIKVKEIFISFLQDSLDAWVSFEEVKVVRLTDPNTLTTKTSTFTALFSIPDSKIGNYLNLALEINILVSNLQNFCERTNRNDLPIDFSFDQRYPDDTLKSTTFSVTLPNAPKPLHIKLSTTIADAIEQGWTMDEANVRVSLKVTSVDV